MDPTGATSATGGPADPGEPERDGDAGEPVEALGPGHTTEFALGLSVESSSIGVPSIPTHGDQDPPPVPVPSIAVPHDGPEPVPVPSASTAHPTTGALTTGALTTGALTTGALTADPVPGDGASPIGAFDEKRSDDPPAPGPATAQGFATPHRPDVATLEPTAGPDRTTTTPTAPATALRDDQDDQDVDSFTPAVRSRLRSYVYLLVDPRSGRPFFAGCGRDDRCFDHVRAARSGSVPARPPAGAAMPSGSGEEQTGHSDEFPALDRIRQVEASGRRVRVEILRYGLEPDVAETVGAAACDLLGLTGDPPAASQRRPAAEVGLLLTKRAKFKRAHQIVLLRVGPPGTGASYERVRHGWRIGRRWVDVTAPRAPHWAVVVVGELVDSVYRLDRWETEEPDPPGSVPGGTGARRAERYSFVGTRDPELESRYVGKSAAPYLRNGPPGSVAYVWSGPHWVNAVR